MVNNKSETTPTAPLAPVTEEATNLAKDIRDGMDGMYEGRACLDPLVVYSLERFIQRSFDRISAAATAKGREAIEILKSFPEASIEEYPLSSRTGKYWPRLARWINTQRDPFINQQGKPHQPSEE